MRAPKVIDDGKHAYEVQFKSEILINKKRHGGACTLPSYKEKAKIEILGTFAPFDMAEALLHEVTHAGEFSELFKVPEATIQKWTGYMCRVIRANFHFTKFLVESINPDYCLTLRRKKRG